MDALKLLRSNGITVDLNSVREIAHSFRVREISVFGSALRGDFDSDSDIDLLVSFDPEADISLFDIMELEERLSTVFGRRVQIVEPEALKNPVRRRTILSTSVPLYAA